MRHTSSIPKIVKVNFINDLERYKLLTPELKNHFDITETKITAKSECFITVDLNDYSEDLFIESTNYYLVPGIITITLTEDNTKSWTMPFDFQVKLFKPADIQEHGKILTLNYTPGETIISQKTYQKITDVTVLDKLLEGQAKYINKPELLVSALMEYLDGLDLNLIETIVQNMFRDTSNPMLPARLTNYSDFQIYGQKKLPFVTSWVNAMAFENIKKAIQNGLISGQNAEDDPITKIVNEKYN